MSEAPQTEAARRAAARKAKILARGNTGLAKLAQTARGDEAQALYAEDFKPSPSSTPRTETPPPVPASSTTSTSTSTSASTDSAQPQSQSQSESQPSWAPPRPPQASASANAASPDQAAMSAQLEAMMSMFGGPPPPGAGAGAGGGGMPDFSQLMAQMMGDPSLAGAGQNLLGDVDDPAGLGGFGPGGIPPNLFGAGDSPFPFPFPGTAPGGARKTKAERYFPLVHFVSIVLLALFSVAWWEPALKAKWAFGSTVIDGGLVGRWASYLGDQRFRIKGVEPVPVFWAFTTVELILQTTRFMIFKSPPPPHSLIQTFLPLLPPKISRPLVTGSRYLTLLLQTYKDGALFVFALGIWTILAGWLSGR